MTRDAATLAGLLRGIGYGGRAARIERCGLDRTVCRDRLCPWCSVQWANKNRDALLQRVRALEAHTVVWATLKTSAGTAHEAMKNHRRAFARFRARTSWPMLGAHHLVTGPARGWLAHTHVLVFGDGDQQALCFAAKKAWADAGGNRKAWAEQARQVADVLGYATRGALDTSWATDAALRAWIFAMRGVRLAVRVRAPGVTQKKRNIPLATHTNDPQARQRIADRVLAIVREQPTAKSAIRRRLTRRDRVMLHDVLGDLQRAGTIVAVPCKRGMRWAAVSGSRRGDPAAGSSGAAAGRREGRVGLLETPSETGGGRVAVELAGRPRPLRPPSDG